MHFNYFLLKDFEPLDYQEKKETDIDMEEIYLKTWRLEIIFNHVDGIIESGDKIYLVRDDVKLIQKDIRRFTLN